MTFVFDPERYDSEPIPGSNPDGFMLTEDDTVDYWFDGALIRFRAKAPDTRGMVSFFECEAPQGWQGPVHRHANEGELFHIQDGVWEIYVNDTVHRATAGCVLWIPPATPHSIYISSKRARGTCYVTPAGFERFFEVVGEPATVPSMPTHKGKIATVDELAAAGARYGWELVEPEPRRLPS
ncbi:cupin domain-containing protein [Streptomyces sp. Lzd4kr]|nr:cupin domain-containing protein [Streptomyces sp. Lzd4kr]